MIDDAFLNDPYPTYRMLHAAGPIHWSEDFFGGAWLLTRYADVANALRDPRFSAQRAGGWVNRSHPQARAEMREFKKIFARWLLFYNAPQHTRLRKVMNEGFAPLVMKNIAPRIQAMVDQLLDTLKPAQEVDFIQEFARLLPTQVIAEMLGIDAGDRADFVAWSDHIAAFIGSPTPSLDMARDAQTSLVALNAYFEALLPARRSNLGDDLMSLLIRAEEAGTVITAKELLAQCTMLLFAGYETTRHFLGNGLFALLKNPAQFQLLREQPTLMRSALKELVRFDSPVQYTGRRMLSDVEMHGKQLRKGELVILLIGAANRDPLKFSEPDTLDLARDQGSALSFGYGPHVCLGARLTQMEAHIAFESLIQRFSAIHLLDDMPRWTGNAVYRGLATLPVRLEKSASPQPDKLSVYADAQCPI